MMINIIGWIGAFLLAFCGLPECYLAIKNKNSNLSWSFLLMWGIGEVFLLIPVILQIKSSFLLFNYIANIVFISIICWYKWRKI